MSLSAKTSTSTMRTGTPSAHSPLLAGLSIPHPAPMNAEAEQPSKLETLPTLHHRIPNRDSTEGSIRSKSTPKQATSPEEPDEMEIAASERIAALRAVLGAHSTTAKQSKQALQETRSKLAAELSVIKQHLAKNGRSGRWTAFLKTCNLSKASADRYVKAHDQSHLNGEKKLLTEEIQPPTSEQIATRVNQLAPKLRAFLQTEAAIGNFLDLMRSALSHNASSAQM